MHGAKIQQRVSGNKHPCANALHLVFAEVFLFGQTKKLFTMLCGLSPHRPRNEISCVAFSADSKRLASGSDDNKVYVWSENMNLVLRYGCPIFYVAFSSDGNMLAAGSCETLYISSVESGMLLHSLPFQCGDANHASVAFSSDNRWVAAASNVSMSVWNVATSDVASAFTLPYAFSLPYISMVTFRAKSNVFFNPNGVASVIVLLDNGAVHALSEASQQHLCTLTNAVPLLNWNAGSDVQYWSGAFLPHTGLIVLGTSNGEIHVYDTRSGELRYKKTNGNLCLNWCFQAMASYSRRTTQ